MFEQGVHLDLRSILWTEFILSLVSDHGTESDRSAVTRLRVHDLCHGRHAALHHPYDHCYHARGSLKCDRRELLDLCVTKMSLTTPLSSPRATTFSSETSTGTTAISATLSTTATPETTIPTLSTTPPASLSEAIVAGW